MRSTKLWILRLPGELLRVSSWDDLSGSAWPERQGVAVDLELQARLPDKDRRPTPVLFVHGSWHGAWCWENFLPYFADRGYCSYALSLRGHGNSGGRKDLRWSSTGDYVADVEQIVRAFDAPPVIVGHSMGGYVVQRYLERHAAAAGVLLATIPSHGVLRSVLRLMSRYPAVLLKNLRQPDRARIQPTLARASLFSADMSAAESERHIARLGRESFRMVLETMFLGLRRPKRVTTPLLVLAAGDDWFFSVNEQQSTARAYGTTAEVFEHMAYDMMLEPGWQVVAARIVVWLQERAI